LGITRSGKWSGIKFVWIKRENVECFLLAIVNAAASKAYYRHTCKAEQTGRYQIPSPHKTQKIVT
jgi:hypothetical protein